MGIKHQIEENKQKLKGNSRRALQLKIATSPLTFTAWKRKGNRFFFFSLLLKFFKVKEQPKLEKILKNAATKDNTVIITTLNEAWAAPNSLLDLFLESFRLGNGTDKLLDHLVIIAMDQKAYEHCLVVHKHCFTLVTDGIDFHQEAGFMTPIYLTMMWRRTEFLQHVLEMGYNFIFTDTDIMWFRDPFPQFYSDADFQIACDQYTGKPNDMNNRPNGGYMYVKSNNRSREFYKFWTTSRETYPGTNEQDVFNIIKFDPYISKIGFKVKFLDTAYFGGFCTPSRDLNLVCTMHANCCFGLDNKLYDLRLMLQDWRAFMSLPKDLKHEWIVSWRVPQKCKYSKPPKKL
ncbi:hypothetical protein SLEP1_g24368 [Rubroshorea leprosula]|uniref:Nucleotide-diphospho-sugar transferase domain-containing protein n=2 Tax=Rubroshorea leprosula TaxID=152421 RepID=A0AAV5JPZ8_9ROSI|nr:hypothetical protein SLEP1_g24368 [Rubroshorea leprosula]